MIFKGYKQSTMLSHTRKLSFILALGLLSWLMMARAGAHADSRDKKLSPTDFRYELVMNADDALCRPLAKLYNSLLHKLARDFATHGAQFGPIAPSTDFEVENPEKFAPIGLDRPAPTGVPGSTLILYSIDLFREGKPRLVSLHDITLGNDISDTEITILKAGATYREIDVPNPNVPGIVKRKIDPQAVDEVSMLHEAPAENYKEAGVIGYPLVRWPGFEWIYRHAIHTHHLEYVPTIGHFATTRLFTFRGKAVFITNEYFRLPPKYNYDSVVVAFRLMPDSRTDLCYVALTPTWLTEATRRYAK